MVEYDTIKAKDFALEDEIMKDYVKESEEATFHNGFGEAYDKEWALTDQGKREGLKQGIEQGIQKGIEQGIEQGIKKGSLNKAREIAKAMLQDKFDINMISKYTNLPIEEIKKI